MAKKDLEKITDFEKCKCKIQSILKEYNCELLDPDEGHWVLLYDIDTNEMDNIYS